VKKVNFVYEWIGPNGPLTNNRVPNILDLALAQTDTHMNNVKHDLIQSPHFPFRVPNSNIVSSYKIPPGKFVYELNFHNFHYRDIDRAFHHSDGLLANNNIHRSVINRIKNKEGYFLVTLLFEGFVQDTMFRNISTYFRSQGIPLTQIIYVTNCYNGKDIYSDYCKRQHELPELNIEYCPVFRIDKTDVQLTLEQNKPYKPGLRNKKFLCFNRRYNDHRLLFYIMMNKHNLVDTSFVSMSKNRPHSNEGFSHYAKHALLNYPNLCITEIDADAAEKKLPLVLDTDNFSSYPMESNEHNMRYYYENSYINIITETYFFNNIIHLTEKTFKPIAFKQPFVMVAAPKSLQHVRDMGFKTFNDFWDESYDDEFDHEKRFLKITQLVSDINNWSDDQFIKFTNSVSDILEFNAAHLRDFKNIEMDEFAERYGE
jgi:hypothetical protein